MLNWILNLFITTHPGHIFFDVLLRVLVFAITFSVELFLVLLVLIMGTGVATLPFLFL